MLIFYISSIYLRFLVCVCFDQQQRILLLYELELFTLVNCGCCLKAIREETQSRLRNSACIYLSLNFVYLSWAFWLCVYARTSHRVYCCKWESWHQKKILCRESKVCAFIAPDGTIIDCYCLWEVCVHRLFSYIDCECL